MKVDIGEVIKTLLEAGYYIEIEGKVEGVGVSSIFWGDKNSEKRICINRIDMEEYIEKNKSVKNVCNRLEAILESVKVGNKMSEGQAKAVFIDWFVLSNSVHYEVGGQKHTFQMKENGEFECIIEGVEDEKKEAFKKAERML